MCIIYTKLVTLRCRYDKMSTRVAGILDMPDEILVEILLHLNARERAVLGNFCERIESLVFSDKKLFKELDFSKEGRLTPVSDIERYLKNENTSKLILKIDLRNVICMEPERLLNDSISKASNLVDINIHGIELKDLHQLGSFLKPLILVRRLSMDWPVAENVFYDRTPEFIREPLSRLIYLSVRTRAEGCLASFFDISQVCQGLKELRVINDTGGGCSVNCKDLTPLENLESFEFYGDGAADTKDELLELLVDPEYWIGFLLPDPLDEKCFYLVKDLQICKELEDFECVQDLPYSWEWTLGSRLRSEWLLKAVIKITQTKVPEKFCSQISRLDGGEQSALKIEDAKLLLNNPRHQIKYLYLNDSIGTKCENHLYSLASSSVTELYLSGITKIKNSTSQDADSKKKNLVLNENGIVPSFEMLIEKTPLVVDLTLNGRTGELGADEIWDLMNPLNLIQRWKNLQSLRLLALPISDGKFLIEIGKECKSLEELEFYNLGPSDVCCYAKELPLMLSHCLNLRDFSMKADNIGEVSKVFLSLARNLKLRRVRLTSFGEMNDTVNLISSVEHLLRCCSTLTTFVCIIDGISQADSDQLAFVLRRLRVELERPSLQFQVTRTSDSNVSSDVDRIHEDSVIPSFPHTWEECRYS